LEDNRHGGPKLTASEVRGLDVRKVTLRLPDGNELWKDLSFSLKEGQRLIVNGSSGVGKSTLVRALAGLWQDGDGEIRCPESTIFLSQEPYLPVGSLRRILTFPAEFGTFSDDAVLQAARQAQLGSTLERYDLDEVQDWEAVLSRGEQQRCTLCRAMLMKPELLVLDEATSALGPEQEASLYDELEAPLIVSISHRPELLAKHTHLLQHEQEANGGKGSWSLGKLDGGGLEEDD